MTTTHGRHRLRSGSGGLALRRWSLAALLVTAALLVGCGGSDDDSEASGSGAGQDTSTQTPAGGDTGSDGGSGSAPTNDEADARVEEVCDAVIETGSEQYGTTLERSEVSSDCGTDVTPPRVTLSVYAPQDDEMVCENVAAGEKPGVPGVGAIGNLGEPTEVGGEPAWIYLLGDTLPAGQLLACGPDGLIYVVDAQAVPGAPGADVPPEQVLNALMETALSA